MSSASGARVRTTQGWKQPSGLERVALFKLTLRPKRICEPRQTLMIGRVMWDEFFNNMDWPMASAVTVAMVLLLLVPMAVFQYYQVKELEGVKWSSLIESFPIPF